MRDTERVFEEELPIVAFSVALYAEGILTPYSSKRSVNRRS